MIVDGICDWLIEQALGEPALESVFLGCCQQLHAAGLPLARVMMAYSTLHPLYRSRTLVFRPGQPLIVEPHRHGEAGNQDWRSSPMFFMIENGVFRLRRRLVGSGAMLDFPVLREFRDEGLADYFACMSSFDGDRIRPEAPNGMICSWATAAADGFADDQLAAIARVQRQLAIAIKVRVKEEIAGNVLAAYLGPQAGRKVLAGSIRLGDGDKIHAIVWYSDLRDSTALAAGMPDDEFLALLNDYFQCTAGAVLDHGGEVLRFVGDAVLAIFPVPDGDSLATAGANALSALAEARARGRRLLEQGRPARFGVALHIGDVLFGNIGVPSRVEFSVIGPCANEVARIESLTKQLGHSALLSAPLVEALSTPAPGGAGRRPGLPGLEDLGSHAVAGVAQPMHVYGVAEEPSR